MGGQFLLLGTSPIPEIDARFRQLQTKYANERNIHIHLERDEEIARIIYAASDLFIIPSLFEPCGLTQLIAMRFGAIPIVRLTGGLADTVFDIDTSMRPFSERNGFTFDFPDKMGVNWALDRAIDRWNNDKTGWEKIVENAICYDSSWQEPAKKYLRIYEKAATRP
jgi:starch synthase